MAKTKIINGERFSLTLSGNISGRKATATKTAEKMRELGYKARVIKSTMVSGRSKDAKGKTTAKYKTTRHDVYIKK